MSSSAFTPSTTTVTNNVPVNVPVVTAWEAYTPVFSGVTATGSVYYRRVGDSIEVEGLVDCTASAGTTFKIGLPTGLTIDATKVSGNNKNILGQITVSNGGGGAGVFTSGPSGLILTDSSDTSAVFVATLNATDASGNVTGTNVTGSGLFNATTQGTFKFTAPIANWAGSGTTTLATRAVEEYAWNSDPGVATGTNYSNSVYYGNGPSGTPLLSYASTTNSGYSRTTYYCRFPSTIQATDKISLELSGDGGLTWNDASQFESSCFLLANGAYYGAQYLEKIDSTTVRIGFGNAGRRPDATYGGVGAAWSTLSNHRWRVRKVSSGSQVGYPVSARNIVGDTSGTVVPTGMIGEVLEAQSSNASVLVGSYAQVVSLTLTAGVWSVSGTNEMDGTASCTGIASKFYTKGIAGSVRAKDFIYMAVLPASSSAAVTFLPRIVVIASTDSDKTVSLYAESRGATSKVWGALSAIRIA